MRTHLLIVAVFGPLALLLLFLLVVWLRSDPADPMQGTNQHQVDRILKPDLPDNTNLKRW